MTGVADTTDAELLGRFRAGDATALESLFARYEEPVFRFLFGVLCGGSTTFRRTGSAGGCSRSRSGRPCS